MQIHAQIYKGLGSWVHLDSALLAAEGKCEKMWTACLMDHKIANF